MEPVRTENKSASGEEEEEEEDGEEAGDDGDETDEGLRKAGNEEAAEGEGSDDKWVVDAIFRMSFKMASMEAGHMTLTAFNCGKIMSFDVVIIVIVIIVVVIFVVIIVIVIIVVVIFVVIIVIVIIVVVIFVVIIVIVI